MDFWYLRLVLSRRTSLAAALCLVLALPFTAVAQETAAPSPSVSPSASPAASAVPVEASPAPWPTLAASPVPSPPPSAEPTLAEPTVGETVEVSAELDFKVGKWKLRKVRWKDLRINGGGLMPVETVGPQNNKGVPMSPLGRSGNLIYNPTVVAQQGMKRLDTYKRTGNKVHLRQARKYADLLERISEGGKKRRWQPHRYGYGVHKAGWVNSNSHGLTLSFLSRFYQLTGAKDKLEQARLLFEAFRQRPQNQRWFSLVTNAGYIWFEHWPDGTNDRTLNAHLNAMFGLYDYWIATGDPLAKQYFLGGAKTVRDKLYRFRRKGNLSRYSLADTDGTVHYHETHILQLRILAKMTGERWFRRQAHKFKRDGEVWKDKYRRGNASVNGR